jgi:hypothetical protein
MNEQIDKIIRHATVVYTDGISEQFEILRLTQKGVIIGRIINNEFITCGFIFKRNIKQIKNDGKKV